MPNRSPAELQRIVDRVRALPERERAAAILRESSGDVDLRRELETRIASADSANAAAEEQHAPVHEGPGSHMGPYRLVERLGEGGFGVVFLAEQEQPIARRVALKIIKLGMDTRQVVARFEAERQALAMLDHPNIARVIDAGATDTGRPYFVMELVSGKSIAEWCDERRATIEERLELFEQVCVAVQHAHTKGIIHRDLKPSNVLVTTVDGLPQVKVIDFGIAKATSTRLTDKSLVTENLQVLGTLQYMSPEQASGSLDIDTRTDVYSLGVMLYELLTGTTPFELAKLVDATFGEIQRLIREVDPPRPSTRLGESRETLVGIAARRRIEPERVGALLAGELDWITMKALEKDRARRYESAHAFALDVRRHLDGDAVSAAPPSSAYRARKFVLRHRGVVLAGSAVAGALVIGVVAFAWQARVARGERDRARDAQTAEAEQRRTADAQRDRAVRAEAETARRAAELELVTSFQDEMLAQVDTAAAGRSLSEGVLAQFSNALAAASVPASEHDVELAAFADRWRRVNATDAARNLIDRTILAPAAEAIERRFEEQPLVAAKLRMTLATRYRELGLYDAALPLQERVVATRRGLLGDAHVDTLLAINDLGAIERLQGRLAEAEQHLGEALDGLRKALGDEHPTTIQALVNVGDVLHQRGQRAEAEKYLRTGLDLARRVLGGAHETTRVALIDLGNFLREQNDLAGAEPLLREALDLYRGAGRAESLEALYCANSLGLVLVTQGKLDDGAQYWRETLETGRRVLGEDHPDTIVFSANLAGLLIHQGKAVEAEPLYRDALEKFRRLLGPDHPNSIQSLCNLAICFQNQQRAAEAEVLLREAVERGTRVLGADHLLTGQAKTQLRLALEGQGKPADPEPPQK